MSDELLFEVTDKVATITFNRPDKLNAFTDSMIRSYIEALQECRDNPDIAVAVLTGAGRGFCSGGDVGGMGGAQSKDPYLSKSRLWDMVQHVPQTIAAMDKPIIAAVNGVAAGAGMDMALHCDFRIAAQSARFSESYVRIGLVPGNGGCWFLPRIVGQAKALELLLTGDFVDAQEAKAIGLVNHVFPDEALMDRTYEIARRIASRAPISVALIKRATYQGLNVDLRTHLDQISSHMIIARASEDHAEAVAAFKEKRDPVFKGR